jgi:integrase
MSNLGSQVGSPTTPSLRSVTETFLRQRATTLASGAELRRTLERDLLPALGDRPIGSIRRGEIVALIEARAHSAPRAAALLLAHIKQLWLYAEDRELLESNRVGSLRAARIHPALRPTPRQRVLSDAEIRGFWFAIEHAQVHPMTTIALKLILATGQRPGEVCGMRWPELDGGTWIIPAARRGKTRSSHRVPLPALALELLERARPISNPNKRASAVCGTSPVFTVRGQAPLGVNALGHALRRNAQTLFGARPPWTLHDLRRTCRTGLAALGVPEEVAERVIGHLPRGIVSTYNLHRYQAEIGAALEAWCAHLSELIQ